MTVHMHASSRARALSVQQRDYLQLVLEADSDVRLAPEGMAPAAGEPAFAGREVRISALTDPEVIDGSGHTFRRSDAGWRDALCDLINERVHRAIIVDNIEFRVDFEGQSVFRVSLRNEDRRGPEAVNVFGKGWWVL